MADSDKRSAQQIYGFTALGRFSGMVSVDCRWGSEHRRVASAEAAMALRQPVQFRLAFFGAYLSAHHETTTILPPIYTVRRVAGQWLIEAPAQVVHTGMPRTVGELARAYGFYYQ